MISSYEDASRHERWTNIKVPVNIAIKINNGSVAAGDKWGDVMMMRMAMMMDDGEWGTWGRSMQKAIFPHCELNTGIVGSDGRCRSVGRSVGRSLCLCSLSSDNRYF